MNKKKLRKKHQTINSVNFTSRFSEPALNTSGHRSWTCETHLSTGKWTPSDMLPSSVAWFAACWTAEVGVVLKDISMFCFPPHLLSILFIELGVTQNWQEVTWWYARKGTLRTTAPRYIVTSKRWWRMPRVPSTPNERSNEKKNQLCTMHGFQVGLVRQHVEKWTTYFTST